MVSMMCFSSLTSNTKIPECVHDKHITHH